MEDENILEMKGIHKRFAGVVALNNVDFSIKKGEVHALMGENGAGKSTLIKVLTGIYAKDGGSIEFAGCKVNPASVLEAQNIGISTIYQEISLIPQLSVAENLFIGREIVKNGVIQIKEQQRRSVQMLCDLGIEIDVTRPVSCFGVAIQQMITIARAISLNAKLVIMDESTSSLSDDEVRVLFCVINRLKAQGLSVLFISHRLGEIFEICDRVTILKDGELVGTYRTNEITMLQLISKMIGRDACERTKLRGQSGAKGKCVLRARGIRSGMRLNGFDIDVGAGEIVGLAGLLGSGRTELARTLFGADPVEDGEVYVEEKRVRFKGPKDAIAHGLAYLPENRKADGILPHLSVRDNLCVANLKRFSTAGILSKAKQQETTDEYIRKINIKTPSREQAIRNLSGGNQQKVLLARWLAMKPKVMILDEPTRGIDVGAKEEIESLIRQMADQGIGVLYISSELEELVRNCDRVEVIRDGRNKGTLEGDEISEQAIMSTIAKGGGGAQCS